jgi:AbrB family looped-hinge helix DNA binding protein
VPYDLPLSLRKKRDLVATNISVTIWAIYRIFTVKNKESKGGFTMHISKISSKGQVTLPKEVREAVGLHPGDMIAYEVKDGVIVLRHVEPFDAAFHAALSNTLDEWATPEDDKAFRDL